MTDTTLPPMVKAQPITMDFFMSQVRLALVAVLAYGGGKGWFTPQEAGLYMTLFTALGPIALPWAWSIVSNFGKVFVSVHSAAAVVAKVEAVDQNSANVGATNALIAASGKVIALLIGLLLLWPISPASAQLKLTGNPVRDFAPASASPAKAGTLDSAMTDFNSGVQKVTKDIVDRAIADVSAAQKDAENHNDQISLPCWKSMLTLLQSLPSQWETPPSVPIGLALSIQIQRDLLNSITGADAGSLKVACAALIGDQIKIVANISGLLGIRLATGGLF